MAEGPDPRQTRAKCEFDIFIAIGARKFLLSQQAHEVLHLHSISMSGSFLQRQL